jgi:hypothetical protein
VTLGGTATGVFSDKDAGTAKIVTISGNTLGGAQSTNYTLVQQTGVTADITPKTLTVTALTNTKNYDGKTSAKAIPTYDGLQTGDRITGLIERYDNPDVGSGKTLIPSADIIDGNGGNNYSVIYHNDTTGTILPVISNLNVDFVRIPGKPQIRNVFKYFKLPGQIVKALLSNNEEETVTMDNGDSLPLWISYDAVSKEFTFYHIPNGVLQLTLKISTGSKSWIIDIPIRQLPVGILSDPSISLR